MDSLSYAIVLALILGYTIITSLGGLGAAFVIIPTLLAFGYPIELAALLGLCFNFLTTLTSSIRHYQQKSIQFQASIPIILVSLIGAPVGALLVNIIPAEELKLIFAIVLILIGINNLRKLHLKRMEVLNKLDVTEKSNQLKNKLILSMIIGFFIGFVSGLLGIGGGAIVLPLLLYFNIPAKKAAGTTSFIIVFSSLVGIFSKSIINTYDMDFTLFWGGIIVSIIGAMLGSYAMHFKLKQSQIKLIISLLIIVVGIKMNIDYLVK